ncbi:MAG TPA: cytochrome c peroxidase [Thermoanaerobaculia bacterium]|nr:cytochrome c peroxidase [Thermoanaerobaculia bacterium]
MRTSTIGIALLSTLLTVLLATLVSSQLSSAQLSSPQLSSSQLSSSQLSSSQGASDETEAASDARLALGKRLFGELNFTNPATDYATSCGGCHTDGGTVGDRATRRFADYTPRSLTATRELTLRNTPTLLDAAGKEELGWAGGSSDLEALIVDKLTGPLYGWGEDGRARALAAIDFTLQHEGGAGSSQSYAEEFAGAYGVDLEPLGAEETVGWGARAIADYVRSLASTRTAPWDAFVTQNRLHEGPNPGESAESYASGVVYSRLANQEGRGLVRRPQGFTREAYTGFKTFFRTFREGNEPVGSCVLCHTPPLFTDGRFHDMGIAQAEYQAVHGDGSAASYRVPAQPSASTRAVPSKEDPARIDLGRFNVTGDPEDAAAFATPTLRHLAGTDPYMHNGAYATLEDALRAKMRLSALAREGKLPDADPLLARIEIGEDDIPSLVAFLRQLDEVGEERFREYLITFEDD